MWLVLTLFACVNPDAAVDPSNTTPVVFEVPAGSSAGGIGPKLVDAGLVSDTFSWKMFLRQTDANCLKAGKFKLQPSMSLNELLKTMCGPPLSDEVPFTIIEGWRIKEIDEALVAKGWIEAGDYKKLAISKDVTMPFEIETSTLEGYLYPETYMVDASDFQAKDLIERQLKTFKTRFLDKHDLGKRSLHEVVVMASMLEREEPKDSQRPLVSGILWKRLDAKWHLGVDATSRYTLDKWNDRKAFLGKLRDESDPYNTRLRPGLPPTPIGSPTLSALVSAVNPEQSEFWYYLHDDKGTLHPAKDEAGHTRNRRKYSVW